MDIYRTPTQTHLHRRYISVMALCSVFLNLHLLLFVCLTIEALGVAKPSVASYLSQEILAEQEADRVHGLPAQPPVKFNNMVVISLSMKLKEEHCSIGFSRPLTNQNKNPFFYGSMEVLFLY